MVRRNLSFRETLPSDDRSPSVSCARGERRWKILLTLPSLSRSRCSLLALLIREEERAASPSLAHSFSKGVRWADATLTTQTSQDPRAQPAQAKIGTSIFRPSSPHPRSPRQLYSVSDWGLHVEGAYCGRYLNVGGTSMLRGAGRQLLFQTPLWQGCLCPGPQSTGRTCESPLPCRHSQTPPPPKDQEGGAGEKEERQGLRHPYSPAQPVPGKPPQRYQSAPRLPVAGRLRPVPGSGRSAGRARPCLLWAGRSGRSHATSPSLQVLSCKSIIIILPQWGREDFMSCYFMSEPETELPLNPRDSSPALSHITHLLC